MVVSLSSDVVRSW